MCVCEDGGRTQGECFLLAEQIAGSAVYNHEGTGFFSDDSEDADVVVIGGDLGDVEVRRGRAVVVLSDEPRHVRLVQDMVQELALRLHAHVGPPSTRPRTSLLVYMPVQTP